MFLSLIQSIEKGKKQISRRELYARMVANAWYSVNYFKLSLGKQDSLSKIIENIRDTERVDSKEEMGVIVSKLTSYDVQNLPHSFVSHYLIWNLIPSDPSFNSKKSNKIPDLNTYFDSFFDLQMKAYKVVIHLNAKNRFLEDYLTIFLDLDFHNLQEPNYDAFRNTLQPLVTIARNNGFQVL